MTDPRPIDLLVQNAYVVAFDDAGTVLTDGAIAVDGGDIIDVGPTAEVAGRYAPRERLFAEGRLAMPGLIDSHLPTAQTMMRGLFAELASKHAMRQPMWREYLIPFESNMSEDDVHLSGLLAYSNLLRTGTTTFFDAGGPHPLSMARAAQEAGIRGIVTRSTVDLAIDIPASMLLTTEQAVAENIAVVEALAGNDRVTGAMGLRQIMNCSPELITTIHDEARRRGVKVHTHLLEGMDEIDYAVQQHGTRPVPYLVDLGVFTETLHCAHSVYASPWDLQHYVGGPSVAHCSNNYRFGVPRALEMWRMGVAIGLGTDGAATSQGSLDMFRVASMVQLGQQHIYGVPVHDFEMLEPDEALRMATRGGARALGFGDRIGSLEPGRAADVVLLRLDGPDAAVTVSPFAFLVDAATGRDVDTVLVGGEVVVRNGDVLTVDLEVVRATGSVRQRELVAALG
jgi:5-methylthioadenosine/S-adenosylhomocysteine deaminase